MSGFGAMKQVKEQKIEQKLDAAPVEKVVEKKPPVVKKAPPKVTNPLEAELQNLATNKMGSHVFCGLVAHENMGKTGTAMDAHMHCVNNKTYGQHDMMWAMDFDGGAAACRSAHYGDTPNVRIWNPWMMQSDNRTAYDYPATHQRIMDISMFALEKAKEQNQDGYEGPKLRNFLVTAVDMFDQVCINNMKIYDMDTGSKDAIDASKSSVNQAIGWNWNIRSTRYHQLTAICRQLMHNGVNVFWETHLAPEVFKDNQTGAWRPKWEKQTDNILNQILWFNKHIIRNEDGAPTGEVRYAVEFYKSKTNPALQGQERVVFVTKKGEAPTWYGLPELREGLL
jgi:hypothetical protein